MSAPAPFPERHPDRRAAVRTAGVVGFTRRIDPHDILSDTRGGAIAAEARHVTAYHLHTTLSFSLSRVGRALGRDRSTVSYAVGQVEERRGAGLDAFLDEEARLVSALVALGALYDEAEAKVMGRGR